jgi:hypothetical protein
MNASFVFSFFSLAFLQLFVKEFCGSNNNYGRWRRRAKQRIHEGKGIASDHLM